SAAVACSRAWRWPRGACPRRSSSWASRRSATPPWRPASSWRTGRAGGRAGWPGGGSTIAEGIAVPRAGELTGRIIAALADDVITVSEESIEHGMNLLLEIEKVVAEGAGAAGVAALVG